MSDLESAPSEALIELLKATAGRDRQAFSDLYAVTSGKLFGVILRIVRNRDDAADILQESYLRIWRRAGNYYPDRGAPLSWMIAIARNGALDWLRARRVAPSASGAADIEDRPDLGPNPLEQTIVKTEVQALSLCLDELESRQRECILLAFKEGFTHLQLSQRLDHPLGTVKSWIKRSLARLKECLER